MMDEANYKLALKDFGDPKIQEVQLTTDGEEHYSFARRLTDEAKTTLKKDQKNDTKHKDGPRVPAIGAQWAKDSKKFSATRADQRKVADLWVINSLASPRPKLETYRYAMPGEENVDQEELLVFDRDTKKRITMKADAFKDQTLQVATSRSLARDRDKEKTEPQVAQRHVGQALLLAPQPRPAPRRRVRGQHRDRRGEADHRGAAQHLHRDAAALDARQRPGVHPLVRARRLGPLLPVRRRRHAEEPDHDGRVRHRADRLGRREAPRHVLHRQRPRGRARTRTSRTSTA